MLNTFTIPPRLATVEAGPIGTFLLALFPGGTAFDFFPFPNISSAKF